MAGGTACSMDRPFRQAIQLHPRHGTMWYLVTREAAGKRKQQPAPPAPACIAGSRGVAGPAGSGIIRGLLPP
jgi:hypothetical protein